MDTFGIDAIATYVPRLYLDLTGEWATARNIEVGKVTQGVGVRKMAIPDAHEDAATLAAMAAKRLIDQTKINPTDVDYIAVGTETTVDQSKSMAAYVQGMLARHYNVDLSHVGAPQFQFACIGATYALEAALNRLRAGDNEKPYAIVIATDISKYPLGTPGEYTQGAGAVALLVSKNPRLLAIEPKHATITRDERDFFRPNWSQTAVVDGKYSIDVYLELMKAAYDTYLARSRQTYASIDHYLFHVPFPRMAEYAASALWADGQDRKTYAKSAEFAARMQQKTENSLTLSRDIGNIYSGSLYLALQSLVEHSTDLAGQRIVLCSYGSGASAKVFSGVVQASYREGFRAIAGALSDRHALSLAEYERLHQREDGKLSPSLMAPSGTFKLARFGERVEDSGYRYYEFA